MSYLGILEGDERTQLIRKVRELLPTKPADKRRTVLAAIEEMPQMGFFISPDNMKLGGIMNFSLPAGQWFREATCPGATERCEEVCYALKGYIQFQEYVYYTNWAYILLWPERFASTLKRAKLSPVVRIHVGGDFFEPWYLDLWTDIVKAREDVRFFAYTRSWQNGEGRIAKRFIDRLKTFAELPNARLLLSVDRDTGIPPASLVPGAIRAWMAVDDQDMPKEPVELIFRHKRPSTMTVYPPNATGPEDGTTVCPYERLKRTKAGKALKEGAITCQNCAWCWGAGHEAYGRREDDLSRFNMWAGFPSPTFADLKERVSGMFRHFVPWHEKRPAPPELSGPGVMVDDCACGAMVPCLKCGACLGCGCACP